MTTKIGRKLGFGGYGAIYEVVIPISAKRMRMDSRGLDSDGHNENPWRELHIHLRINSLNMAGAVRTAPTFGAS